MSAEQPEGELVIRTFAMPRDTNANGDIFGGWLLSQMDLGAGIIAKYRSRGRAATVAIDKMSFLHPVHVGDVVCCYAKLLKCGRTSMQIQVQAWAVSTTRDERRQVTEGIFTFVAIDENDKPRPLPEA